MLKPPVAVNQTTIENDSLKEFKFPIPMELQAAKGRPQDKVVHKFIRDCVSCLQACIGNSKPPGQSVLEKAATKICDQVPVLKDTKPPSFYKDKGFPYWVSNIL